MVSYLSYIRYLERNQPQKPAIERFGVGYQDYLQAPLQPLTTNLESITYEVFETDPIKYDWYQHSIELALRDWSSQGKSTSSSYGSVVVAVVGAGRGPLVTRIINASQTTNVKVKILALEKNHNACVVLQQHNLDDWNNNVTIINRDMRSWNGPEKSEEMNGYVDILVSELLGSFGDNELSPECLDGVQDILNPKDGISIPARYAAFLTPVAAPRLFADIKLRAFSDKDAFNTPYVVMLHSIDYLSIEIDRSTRMNVNEPRDAGGFSTSKPCVQEVWSFKHPNPMLHSYVTQNKPSKLHETFQKAEEPIYSSERNTHNTRYAHLVYSCEHRGVCHGLAGYFETVLYDGMAGKVELSTNPVNMEMKSKNMISWFPIFFPLKVSIKSRKCLIEIELNACNIESSGYSGPIKIMRKHVASN